MEDDESEDQDRETIGQRVRLLSIYIYLCIYFIPLAIYSFINLFIYQSINWTSGESLIYLFIYFYTYLFMYNIKMPITPYGQRANLLSI